MSDLLAFPKGIINGLLMVIPFWIALAWIVG